jgi:hypothetical protein
MRWGHSTCPEKGSPAGYVKYSRSMAQLFCRALSSSDNHPIGNSYVWPGVDASTRCTMSETQRSDLPRLRATMLTCSPGLSDRHR